MASGQQLFCSLRDTPPHTPTFNFGLSACCARLTALLYASITDWLLCPALSLNTAMLIHVSHSCGRIQLLDSTHCSTHQPLWGS